MSNEYYYGERNEEEESVRKTMKSTKRKGHKSDPVALVSVFV